MPQSFKNAGYPQYDKSPILKKGWENWDETEKLILSAEVVISGNFERYDLISKRLSEGKLTFSVGERWLKKGILNLLSPHLLKSQWYYHTRYYNKPLYHLCSSAYAANDLYLLRSFRGKCFKWGYFPVVEDIDITQNLALRKEFKKFRFLWVARFIDWKHPELPVKAAKVLASKGYDFEINMYGAGPETEKIKKLIQENNLGSFVNLKGNLPNKDILKEMDSHDAFLFTSDRNEGWGAVVNEAMGRGCPVIGSNAIGAVPFLIQDKENGIIFKDRNLDDLVACMELIIKDSELREKMAINAYKTIQDKWSPKVAAENLLQLIEAIKANQIVNLPSDAPCSIALPR